MKFLPSESLARHCAPHQFGPLDSRRMMLWVLGACAPGMVLQTWFFGVGVLVNLVLCWSVAVGVEMGLARLRRLPAGYYLRDYSALLGVTLLGLCLPLECPWWLPVAGSGFAVLFIKHAFGGLGQNPFNPAMAACLLMLWLTPDVMQGTSLLSALPVGLQSIGAVADSHWSLVNLGYLGGGLILLVRGIVGWRVPFAVIITLSLLLYACDPASVGASPFAPTLQLLGGAVMLTAFFLATDPVTSASTPVGRLVYGILIGVLLYGVCYRAGQPLALPAVIIIANLCAPLIDRGTTSRIYGHRSRFHRRSVSRLQGATNDE